MENRTENEVTEMSNKTMPKHPCIGCIYFKACGETNRTMPCKGRVTKSEKKRGDKK